MSLDSNAITDSEKISENVHLFLALWHIGRYHALTCWRVCSIPAFPHIIIIYTLTLKSRPSFNFFRGHVYLKSSLLIVKLSILLPVWRRMCLVMVLSSTQCQRREGVAWHLIKEYVTSYKALVQIQIKLLYGDLSPCSTDEKSRKDGESACDGPNCPWDCACNSMSKNISSRLRVVLSCISKTRTE